MAENFLFLNIIVTGLNLFLFAYLIADSLSGKNNLTSEKLADYVINTSNDFFK